MLQPDEIRELTSAQSCMQYVPRNAQLRFPPQEVTAILKESKEKLELNPIYMLWPILADKLGD